MREALQKMVFAFPKDGAERLDAQREVLSSLDALGQKGLHSLLKPWLRRARVEQNGEGENHEMRCG